MNHQELVAKFRDDRIGSGGALRAAHNYYNINSCPIATLGTIFNHSATLGNILNHRGWSNEAQVASRAPPTLG